MSVTTAAPNVTPNRDRLPFPPSMHPSPPSASARATASSSASSSSVNLPTAPSAPLIPNQPITIDSLLQFHSNAPNPHLAALDQAVNDRNALSSQNSQLWKLIEKQRAGYNQILKELERVRTERDTYKSKFAKASGGQHGAIGGATGGVIASASASRGEVKRHRSADTENVATLGDSPGAASEGGSSGDHASNPRNGLTKSHSEDQPASRTQHRQKLQKINPSRSQEAISNRDKTLQTNPKLPSSILLPPPPSSTSTLGTSTTIETSTPQRTQKPAPAPLLVPPRSESLPAVGATNENSPSGQHQHLNSDPIPAVPNAPAQIRPLAFQKKPGAPESASGTPTTTSMQSSPPATGYPHHSQTISQMTPPGFGSSSIQPPPSSHHTSHISTTTSTPEIQSQLQPPKIQYTPQAPTPTQAQSSQQSFSSISQTPKATLSAIMESHSLHALSRESRISLPDEARQYIANMTESPLPSPQIDVFAPKASGSGMMDRSGDSGSGPATHPLVVSLNDEDTKRVGPRTEFLDMDDEDAADGDEEDEGEDKDRTETFDTKGVQPLGPPPWIQTQAQSTQPLHVHHQRSTSIPPPLPPSTSPAHLQAPGWRKTRTAADDFPLPPSHAQVQTQAHAAAQAQAQAQAMAQAQAHAQAMAMAETAHQQQLVNDTGYPSSEVLRRDSTNRPYTPPPQSPPWELQQQPAPASFRALPLLSTDLPHTTITVSHSFVRPNDKGKEVLSFIVFVNPGNGKDGWKVEKMYSDVLGLDGRVRGSVGKGVLKKIASLPEGKLWRDHAPAKVDQRKAVLESYLQSLVNLPVKNNDEVIAFFTSDIVREAKQPVMQAGHKEGYLTKRGKNFGGWKTRYFVLQGPVLEYYDCRGGVHSGSITVAGAKIGRQQRNNAERSASTDEEKEYRHAFLIVEAKKGPGGYQPRHVLCAESDEDRDSWVEMLVRYYTGTYTEEPVTYGLPLATNPYSYQNGNAGASRSSASIDMTPGRRVPARGVSREDISISRGPTVPISQLAPDPSNVKLFQSTPLVDDHARSSSPAKSADSSPTDRQGSGVFTDSQTARRILDRGQGQPSSLPDSSLLSAASSPMDAGTGGVGQRANSELGHYPDLQDHRVGHSGRLHRHTSPEKHRTREQHSERKSFHPTLSVVSSSPAPDRVPSPEKLDTKVKISGPLNGVPIPAGYKFGGKDTPSEAAAANERREKAKSRSFWSFGRPNEKSHQSSATYTPRAVFGVTLDESLDVAQIANLPAIVFRSIQYLEAKKAEEEEGIYRLSGSSAVIKSLKDRFNMEGDVDLLASDEYWDPHAIAGLLKSFLRELPASILTRDLHLKFLAVIDFVDAQERIKELSQLIASLPIANYSLLRALTAHLILIVQNSSTNKMTMRNVGIVFSPTLGIPAGVFSLMLGEFNRVFNVDSDNEEFESPVRERGDGGTPSHAPEMDRRNSRVYSDAAADQLLGLSGRTLTAPAEEGPSDDDYSLQDESGTETTDGDGTVESSAESSSGLQPTSPDTPIATKSSKASHTAASRGLNVTVTQSERGNRYSKMIGLPSSPRPTHSSPDMPSSPNPTTK